MSPAPCIVFDIDGTLVDSVEFDDRLFRVTVLEVAPHAVLRDTWSAYTEVTDSGLVRAICQDNGLDATELEPRIRALFGSRIAAHLQSGETCRPTAGALTLWDQLRAEWPARIGIATGGWGHTARMKLESAGLVHEGIPLASADVSPERIEILRHCRAQLPPTGTTVYVGDGEWDQRAALALGWRFVGIGERLRTKCPHWIPDFTAADSLERIIG